MKFFKLFIIFTCTLCFVDCSKTNYPKTCSLRQTPIGELASFLCVDPNCDNAYLLVRDIKKITPCGSNSVSITVYGSDSVLTRCGGNRTHAGYFIDMPESLVRVCISGGDSKVGVKVLEKNER